MQIISGIFLQYFSAEIQMRWKSDESDKSDGTDKADGSEGEDG